MMRTTIFVAAALALVACNRRSAPDVGRTTTTGVTVPAVVDGGYAAPGSIDDRGAMPTYGGGAVGSVGGAGSAGPPATSAAPSAAASSAPSMGAPASAGEPNAPSGAPNAARDAGATENQGNGTLGSGVDDGRGFQH